MHAPSDLFNQGAKTVVWERVVALAAVAVLASVVILLILRYAVAIPMLDDWEMVPLVVKAHQGGLRFADLFVQQQEARPLLPKLVFIALSSGKYWDSRDAMMLSVVICCLTALGIYRLLVRSGLTAKTRTIVFLLSALLLFSPAQHEIWLLASGFPSFLPALWIVWGICVATGRRSIAGKFCLCLALAVCASFSLSNGLLAWGLTFPLVFFAGETERPQKRWLLFWLIAVAICATVYFWNFRPPSDLPAFAPRKTPFEYGQYIAAFLGSSLGRSGNDHPLPLSIAIGALLLAGYMANSILAIRHRNYRTRIAPWLALGGYSIGSACLASLGRIEWGVGQALESRYVAFSIYLAIAVIVLTAIGYAAVLERMAAGRRRLVPFAALVFFGGACVILAVLCAVDSIASFRIRSAAARLGQSAVLFGLALDTSETTKNVNYPRPLFVRENADALDHLRLLRTSLVRTREIAKLRHAETDGATAEGWWDGLTTTSNGRHTAWGWAALPARKRSADGVLLAYANEKGEWIAFALSDAILNRVDVARTLNSADQLWSGWRTEFADDGLPKGAEISAWAVDAKEAKLYRLKTGKPMFLR